VRPGATVLSSITPNEIRQGQTLDAVLEVDYSTFLPEAVLGGAVLLDLSEYLSLNSISWTSDQHLRMTANITADVDAPTGTVDVSMAGAQGTVGFTVLPGLPEITSITPDECSQGETLDVIITGQYFGDVGDECQAGFGEDITVNSCTIDSDAQITVNLTCDVDATPGLRDVTVITSTGTDTLIDGFIVDIQGPTIDSVGPALGYQGQTLNFTIKGTNIASYTYVEFDDPDITINSVTIDNDNQVTINATVSEDATLGDKDLLFTQEGAPHPWVISNAFSVDTPPVPVKIWGQQNPLPTGSTLNDIAGSSSHHVVTVGDGGFGLQFDGSTWNELRTGVEVDLNGIVVIGSSEAIIVGDSGTIRHHDGNILSPWTPMDSGTVVRLEDIWGTSSDDLFVVGVQGTILHYDGSNWSPMTSGTTEHLYDVWGTSSSDVFAVGDGGTILHYDGNLEGTWTPMAGGPSFVGNFTAIWGTSSSDFYAGTSAGLIFHYDGSEWSSVDIGSAKYIYDGWGSSASDNYVVGGISYGSGVIFHSTSPWSHIDSGTTPHLYGIWGSASDDVFAVGEGGTILHYDGSTWSSMTSSVATEFLYGTWGSSSSDIFAVGDDGTILHYDCSTWSLMTSGTAINLRDVWGTSSTDVFAVGGDSSNGTVLHYDGSAWTPMDSGIDRRLSDVWGSSSSDVFAVGSTGNIVHYDGTVWSSMTSGTTTSLGAVWGSALSDVFALGSEKIFHYNGSTWTPMDSGTEEWLSDVWGTSSTDVFAVGNNGTILYYNGSTWTPMDSGTEEWLYSIWGRSSSDIYVTGTSGTILHYDGSTWSPMSSGGSASLLDVWGSSSSDVFAVGSGGTILHYPE
jgi:hypothetical protein